MKNTNPLIKFDILWSYGGFLSAGVAEMPTSCVEKCLFTKTILQLSMPFCFVYGATSLKQGMRRNGCKFPQTDMKPLKHDAQNGMRHKSIGLCVVLSYEFLIWSKYIYKEVVKF